MITEWTRRTQDATRVGATRNGEGWTSEDLAFVVAFANDVTDAELATTLNRTLYSITSIRHAIEAGKRVCSTNVARSDRPYRGWTEDMQDA